MKVLAICFPDFRKDAFQKAINETETVLRLQIKLIWRPFAGRFWWWLYRKCGYPSADLIIIPQNLGPLYNGKVVSYDPPLDRTEAVAGLTEILREKGQKYLRTIIINSGR